VSTQCQAKLSDEQMYAALISNPTLQLARENDAVVEHDRNDLGRHFKQTDRLASAYPMQHVATVVYWH
jgi:hypothetical protein